MLFLQVRAKTQGTVVVVALLMVALMAVLSTAMLSRFSGDITRLELILHAEQMDDYADGGVAWARDYLAQNLKRKKKDARVDPPIMKSPVEQMGPYRIQTEIQDVQGFFNVNQFVGASSSNERMQTWLHFLQGLSINIREQEAKDLATALSDWVNNSSDPLLKKYYEKLPNPYQAPHQEMVHLSELRLVKGMTDDLYAALSKVCIALPSAIKPNILTAPAQVLMTLAPNMTQSQATALFERLASLQTSETTTIMKMDLVNNLKIKENSFKVISEYFLAKTRVAISEQQLVLYTLLKRQETNAGDVTVTIVWQRKGMA